MDLNLITQLWEQVSHSPAWLIIVAVLNVVVFLWRYSERLNNRWIPHICVFCGMALYLLFGPIDAVEKSQRHPMAFMALLGALLGFFSWAANGAITKGIKKKFPDLFPDDTIQQNKTDKSNETNHPQS
jgi:hypothetical protein